MYDQEIRILYERTNDIDYDLFANTYLEHGRDISRTECLALNAKLFALTYEHLSSLKSLPQNEFAQQYGFVEFYLVDKHFE